MSDTPRDLIKFTISNTPGLSGGFTIADPAINSLVLVDTDDGLPFKLNITEPGVGTEIRSGCIYTHSTTSLTRGTMVRSTGAANAALDFTSAAIVSVVPSAEDFLATDKVAAFNEMLVNVGTEEVPVWELQANLIPRTDSFANLTSLMNGGGELCSATDVDAIVQLTGTPGAGSYKAYCPMYPGTWAEGSNGRTTVLRPAYPWIATSWTHDFQVTAPSQDQTQAAGKVSIRGGYNTIGHGGGIEIWPGGGATTKAAGSVTIGARAGDGVGGSGSAVNISSGSATNGATAGNIGLVAGAGTGAGATAGSLAFYAGQGFSGGTNGKITFKLANATVFELGPTEATMGFYGAAAVAKPAVTGSKASGAALTSLLNALSSLGLIDISGVTE